MFLFVVNDFPPLRGGQATLYHALARRLRSGEAVLLAPRLPGDRGVDSGLAIETIRRPLPAHAGGWSRAARSLLVGGHLLAILARRRFEFLVCGQLLSIGAPLALLSRLFRVPYAVFVHGADLSDYAPHPLWGRLARIVLKRADTVVANSRFTASLIDRLAPGAARRVIVLPMGVDPAPARDAGRVLNLRRRYRLGDGPVLLSVSRLVPMKGHNVVIEALPRLAARFPGLMYLVVGDGPHRPVLEGLARSRGVSDRIRFAGDAPPEEMASHFDLATLFVQLSRATGTYDGLEGFGLTFLEAASHGLVSIAGHSGGVPEAVADHRSGLLVPPDDVEVFTATATRLLTDPDERRRLSEGARRWASDHSWDAGVECLRRVAGGAAEPAGASTGRAA